MDTNLINELGTSEIAQTPEMNNEVQETDVRFASLSPAVGYGIYRVSQMPEVREAVSDKVESCKEAFAEVLENAKETVTEKAAEAKEAIAGFAEKLTDGIKDFFVGAYEDVKEIFVNPKPKEVPFAEFSSIHAKEGIQETREFGLDACSEAAMEIFNPGVIDAWGSMTERERKAIALEYAERVAQAFELVNYEGVYIEKLEPGTLGYNNGDGTIHLTNDLLSSDTTPFLIMDTITHELRHQYQNECIRGYHDVPDEVRNESAVATAIYNYNHPSCYDPWGYIYNPLEIDSNYAGNTVVRNVSSQMFNNVLNNA